MTVRTRALNAGRSLALIAGVGLCLLLGLAGPASAAGSQPAPSFNCAAANGDGTYTYFFGYTLAGSAVTIPVGANNGFPGGDQTGGHGGNSLSDNYADTGWQNRGQPTTFQPGAHPYAFSVTTAETSLQWHLAGSVAAATAATLCANVPVVAEAPSALVLPIATAAPFAIWFVTMRRRSRRTLARSLS